ncbi:hypothetical protein LS684_22170 (plasmid) [Cytobacillus spongiae]|uniref:hypothetical protein n=1 Tax=Cytobacillus spongiae TaxID=2901381 RepID=UPI001CD4C005|nr:hypothetical protein [Cytobacillus spongiae]MCA1062689.1 hypothetical protein [Rossellomorea aquimaris]UII58316.1 hypothetical protein LS684_22170 [Cytobacillus spongiae]WJV28643.1 hypothetical protein QTG56_16500 [Rossellomorea sp. AcN35-11]
MDKLKQNKVIFLMFTFTSVINFLVFWLDPESYMYLIISLIFFLNACVFFINSRDPNGPYRKWWIAVRVREKWFFSVLYGGCFAGFIFTIILYGVLKDHLILIIVICVTGGWLWGLIIWLLNEKRYGDSE